MKLILPFFKKNRLKITTGILFMILVDGAQLLVPQIIKKAVDSLAGSAMDRDSLAVHCFFIVGLAIIMALLRYGWRILLMGSARDLERGIRDHLYRHILELDTAYYDRVKTGDIMAHATSDITHVRMAFGFGIIALVDTLLLGGACLAIMVWTDPKLTALALIPMPFLILAIKVLGKKVHLLHRSAQESFSLLTEQIREGFFGIRVIKVFNLNATIENKVKTAAQNYFGKNLKRAFTGALLRPMLTLFLNISTLIIIFYGGLLVIGEKLSPGELVAFLQYLGILAWPVIAIGWMTNLFQRGTASLKRLNTMLDTGPGVGPPISSALLDRKRAGQIRIKNLSFSHEPLKPVLLDINLDILPGTRLGITGPPGSGKTSLIQMIPRIYDPDRGRVCIGGQDIKNLDPDLLRSNLALMPQEPFLFSGTLEENILLGRKVDIHRLEKIIHACDLDHTVSSLSLGMETLVGERGVTLSGGQKQRVALARTLVVEKPVLLLDDPVSQLDTRTAKNVMSRIQNLNQNSTIIIISHRISALAACDSICILNRGKITAQASHNELLHINDYYSKAFRVQQFEEAEHGK